MELIRIRTDEKKKSLLRNKLMSVSLAQVLMDFLCSRSATRQHPLSNTQW